MGCRSSSYQSEAVSQKVESDFHNDYVLGIKLGQGAFAQVRKTELSRVERPFQDPRQDSGEDEPDEARAVKIVRLREEDTPDKACPRLQKVAQQEVAIWRAIGYHPNCVFMHNSFFGFIFCYMVMEKCNRGLSQALEEMTDLSERDLGNVFAQMLLGLSHCHNANVVHRDIKPNNFVVGGTHGQTVKLLDFGLSAILNKRGTVSGILGTGPYMAPEMLAGKRYDTKSDMWSFAVMVYVLVYGQFPYPPMWQATTEDTPTFTPMRLFGDAPNGLFRSDFRSPAAVELIKSTLTRDPQVRPSAEDALTLPWMVASLEGTHLPGADIPCLQPMLISARKAGAFDIYEPGTVSADDVLLVQMQNRRPGIQHRADEESPKMKPTLEQYGGEVLVGEETSLSSTTDVSARCSTENSSACSAADTSANTRYSTEKAAACFVPDASTTSAQSSHTKDTKARQTSGVSWENLSSCSTADRSNLFNRQWSKESPRSLATFTTNLPADASASCAADTDAYFP